MAKVNVITNVRIEIDPPRWTFHSMRNPEKYAQELESWAREFEAFVRDHRSQDAVSLSIHRDCEDQCSHCGSQWEVDATGEPMCCQRAQDEWLTEAEKVAAA